MVCVSGLLSVRCSALCVYFFPAIYGTLMIAAALIELPSSISFSVVFFAFGTIFVVTSLVGQLGVVCKNENAIRATVVLLVLENLMVFLLTSFLLFEIARGGGAWNGSVDPVEQQYGGKTAHLRGSVEGTQHYSHLAPLNRFLRAHPVAALITCIVLYIGTLITSCCIGVISELQAQMDAELLLHEARKLPSPNAKQPLLSARKLSKTERGGQGKAGSGSSSSKSTDPWTFGGGGSARGYSSRNRGPRQDSARSMALNAKNGTVQQEGVSDETNVSRAAEDQSWLQSQSQPDHTAFEAAHNNFTQSSAEVSTFSSPPPLPQVNSSNTSSFTEA